MHRWPRWPHLAVSKFCFPFVWVRGGSCEIESWHISHGCYIWSRNELSSNYFQHQRERKNYISNAHYQILLNVLANKFSSEQSCSFPERFCDIVVQVLKIEESDCRPSQSLKFYKALIILIWWEDHINRDMKCDDVHDFDPH